MFRPNLSTPFKKDKVDPNLPFIADKCLFHLMNIRKYVDLIMDNNYKHLETGCMKIVTIFPVY